MSGAASRWNRSGKKSHDVEQTQRNAREAQDQNQVQDAQIAFLASLLEPATFSTEEYVAALQNSAGDMQLAAEELLLPRVKSAGKRKAGTSLESWLGRKRGGNGRGGPKEVEPVADVDVDLKRSVLLATKDEESVKPARDQDNPTKPRVDAFSVLLNPTSQPKNPKAKATPQPAVRLATQAQIDSVGLPLTNLTSPLSPSLASALYLTMMEESEKWERNRWYLAGRWVESPHTLTSYARGPGREKETGDPDFSEKAKKQNEGKYYYSGTEQKTSANYPPLLAKAAEIIEPVVNAAINARRRYRHEFAGPWRANVCGANRYDGASSSVGWHADQLTYLGPYPTIASLSLGTPRNFRLRETDAVDPTYSSGKPIRTYEVTLGHNSLVLMNAGCQERFKHTVPSQKALDLFRPGWDIEEVPIPLDQQKTYTSRINITFRFYRPDFHPAPSTGPAGPRQGTPICRCGIPTLLRADQKAKARSRLGPPSPAKKGRPSAPNPGGGSSPAPRGFVDDDMVFFWQCQSPGQTGDLKGCGFFRIFDMGAEGRGPCIGDR